MSDVEPQSYRTHRRYVFGFHGVAFGLLLINFVWAAFRAATRLTADSIVAFLLAVTVFLLFYYTRSFATTLQDRVIRLEERLRLKALLPPDLAPAIEQLTMGQLIALRFASDEELPELIRRIRREGIRDREAIKRLIQSWRADYLRV